MNTRVYYFYSDFDWYDAPKPSELTEQDILELMKTHTDIERYSIQGFEWAFNDEEISDLGYIRIFTD